jgi:hypothetical protein
MFDKVGSNLAFIHRDHTEVLNGSNNLRLVEFAFAITPSVRIVLLTLKATSFLEITESCGHLATIAS